MLPAGLLEHACTSWAVSGVSLRNNEKFSCYILLLIRACQLDKDCLDVYMPTAQRVQHLDERSRIRVGVVPFACFLDA